MFDYQTAPLVKATVHGSRWIHLVPDGHALTLCGMVGDYPHRWQPERDPCTTCQGVARRADRLIPC